MMFYQMPTAYYHPYQAMLLQHYAQQPFGRSGTSAFAAGDAIAAGTYLRGLNPLSNIYFSSSKCKKISIR